MVKIIILLICVVLMFVAVWLQWMEEMGPIKDTPTEEEDWV